MGKKIIYLLLIFGLAISMLGCIGKSPKQDENKEKPPQPLTEQDFSVNYAGVDLTIGINPTPTIEKLDKATSVTGNRVFVGWDSEHKYKYFSRKYPPAPPDRLSDIELITRVNVKTDEAVISEIDLSGYETRRGIKSGDWLEDVEKRYGTPTEVNISDIENTTYTYKFKDKSLYFTTSKYEKTIIVIKLQYNK